MEFGNLYLTSKLKTIADADLKSNMLNHAYLLFGQDEIYLNFLAKQFAKHVLCKNNICGVCPTCKKIEKGVHADVLCYPKTDDKNIVVEDVNEIVEKAYVYPMEESKKIFILNNFDLATVQAQNKLLKTLEEPPKTSMFVLTSTNPSNILNTIKSRTKQVSVPLLEDKQIETFILNNSTLKLREVAPFVASAQGNLTKAKKIVDDPDFVKIKQLCLQIVLELNKSGDILKYSSKILSFKGRVTEVFDELSLVLLDCLYCKLNLLERVSNNQNINEFLSSNFSVKALKLVYEELLNSQDKLKNNCNVNVVVDNFLITMLEVKHKWK